MEEEFWENRWKNQETGWDMGSISAPLKAYFDQLEDKSLKILIPGCGNAYEAQYLWENGFSNVFVMDISKTALESFSRRFKTFPNDQMLLEDFFQHQGKYHSGDFIGFGLLECSNCHHKTEISHYSEVIDCSECGGKNFIRLPLNP